MAIEEGWRESGGGGGGGLAGPGQSPRALGLDISYRRGLSFSGGPLGCAKGHSGQH